MIERCEELQNLKYFIYEYMRISQCSHVIFALKIEIKLFFTKSCAQCHSTVSGSAPPSAPWHKTC